MEKKYFGTLAKGEKIHLYTLKNGVCEVQLMDRGATVVSFKPYGRDIVGGFDSLEDYIKDTSHQGATIGRVANRVDGAKFTMDGKTYNIPDNDSGNCLHGGDGFDHRVWNVEKYTDDNIVFSYLSHDMEEGFPSELKVEVSFTLQNATLIIDYTAIPNGKTPIALTNHSYFNLNGLGGTIENHKAKIYAETYTTVNDKLIPDGNRPNVKGTAFDFLDFHEIGERVGGDFIGYDHNFVITPEKYGEFLGKKLALCAEVLGDSLKMKVYTDQPGVQFYIGNFLGDGPDFKGGIKPIKHGAYCLETQTEPNCINHGIGFYDKGEVYKHTTVYKIEKI